MSKDSALNHVVEDLKSTFGEAILEADGHAGDTLVRVDLEQLLDICKYLKGQHRFIYLVDILGTDRFTSEDRFEVIYNMVSLRDQLRLFIKVRCPEEDPTVPSVTSIWPAANWNEREVYDMFGIRFDNHPDMRRVYLPQDFNYFPLRKEFPLLGIPGSIDLPSSLPEAD